MSSDGRDDDDGDERDHETVLDGRGALSFTIAFWART